MLEVYPACAGIDPILEVYGTLNPGLPRMRGDRPWEVDVTTKEEKFTPHARGSTSLTPATTTLSVVYPACAGIDPVEGRDIREFIGLPRMRGDRPGFQGFLDKKIEFTPHARGSTFRG